MKVEFGPDVLRDRSAWMTLVQIVDALYDHDHTDDERHLWEIDDLDALLASPWVTNAGWQHEIIAEIAERSYHASATVPTGRRTHSVKIVVTQAPGATSPTTLRLPPRHALEALRAPLRVVVENKRSDGIFLTTMATVFGHRDLLLAITRRWCEFVHGGGGGELLKRVEECLGDGALQVRVCAISDGDRLSPKVSLHPAAERLQKSCSARGVRCFVLHKRESENYLPVEVLALATSGPSLTTFARLTQEQRDHFDMKLGFTLKHPADDPGYEGLYDDLDEQRREALSGGFGSSIGEHFESKRAHFRREHVEKSCETCEGELPAILDALESML